MQVTRRNDAKLGTSPRCARISSWNSEISAFVVQPSRSAISPSTSHTMFSRRRLVSTPWMRIVRERCSYMIGSALTKNSHMVVSWVVAGRAAPWLQIARAVICLAMYSAWRIASVTIVSVGFSAPPVVNWLPSEMKRLLTSWVWP